MESGTLMIIINHCLILKVIKFHLKVIAIDIAYMFMGAFFTTAEVTSTLIKLLVDFINKVSFEGILDRIILLVIGEL